MLKKKSGMVMPKSIAPHINKVRILVKKKKEFGKHTNLKVKSNITHWNIKSNQLKTKKKLCTSTAAISARIKPVPVSIEPKRESPILQDINCAPGATPFNKGS
jgi:hypothetical protein